MSADFSAAGPFSRSCLELDAARAVEAIGQAVKEQIFQELRCKGAVVGLSGGIDSSVVAALLVRALGKDRVLGLFMPEDESSEDTLKFSRLIADHLGIETVLENITPILRAAGCYERRDEAIRKVLPDFGPGWKCKIVLPSILAGESYRIFSVVAQPPEGKEVKARLTPESYHGIVAATSFKQRVRKMLEYYHADRLRYAVAGTPNRLEYDQGFFVKNGDGSADLKPIAHLYKTQVYQLAKHLQIPEAIQKRPPTTDTYSLAQSQEEFYFSLPYDRMDLCLYGKNRGIPAEQVSEAAGLTAEQVERVYRDIDAKRKATRHLHLKPLLVEEITEIQPPPPASRSSTAAD
ncbi:MAG: NAD(+) synthase [Planctomycetes bacterium]|nr:NAD(+) synthase [Planctomycetota bacterium]